MARPSSRPLCEAPYARKKSCDGSMPTRRAIAETFAPGRKDPATTCSLSSSDHRRCRRTGAPSRRSATGTALDHMECSITRPRSRHRKSHQSISLRSEYPLVKTDRQMGSPCRLRSQRKSTGWSRTSSLAGSLSHANILACMMGTRHCGISLAEPKDLARLRSHSLG